MPILALLFLLTLPGDIYSLAKCEQGMLNNYGLAGRVYASHHPMMVCGHIIDSCCAIQDDVKIVTLWNSHTRPIIERHTSYVISNLQSILGYFYPLSELDPELIVVKQVVLRRTPYKQQRCRRRIRNMTKLQAQSFYAFADRKIKRKDKLYEKGVRHWGVFTNLTDPNEHKKFLDMKSSRKKSYYEKVGRYRKHLLKKRSKKKARKLFDAPVSDRLTQLLELNQPVLSRTKGRVTEGVLSGFRDDQGNKLNEEDLQMLSNHFGKPSGKWDESLGSIHSFAPEGRLLSEKSKHPERQLAEKKKSKKKSESKSKSKKKKSKSKKKKKRSDSFLEIPRPKLETLKCKHRTNSYYRDYIIVNPKKVKFCYGKYQDFLHYDMAYMNRTMVHVKKNMIVLGDLRKQFFCALCDGHAQNFFDHKRKLIVYKNDFCSTLLLEFIDYIQFMNILFIEFSDSLLQYVQCFETDAHLYNFPFQNFLVKHHRRIVFFKRCFEQIANEDPTFMKNCWFICNKFSLMRMNPMFDGDLPLLTRIRMALFSFLRKFTQQEELDKKFDALHERAANVSKIDLGTIENVNGILAEPVAPGLLISNKKIYLNPRDRLNLLGSFAMTGMPHISEEVMEQVNTFLTSMNLRSVTELVNLFKHRASEEKNKTIEEWRTEEPHDETNYEVSRVNGMVNKLWELSSQQNVTDFMLPKRKLKDRAIRILKDSGFDGIPRERRLEQFELFPPKVELEQQFSPRAKSILDLSVHNLETKRKKKEKPLPPEMTPHELKFVTEPPAQIFEKGQENIDMINYGVVFEELGLDPLAFFYLAEFEKNVTNIINDHFQKKEKMDQEVLLKYLSYSAHDINEFNEVADAQMVDFRRIKVRDKVLNRYKSVENYALVKDRFKLRKIAAERVKVIGVKTRGKSARKRREIQRMKMMRKYEKAKAFDAMMGPDLSKHLLHSMPNYNETFSTITEFFSRMFGP